MDRPNYIPSLCISWVYIVYSSREESESLFYIYMLKEDFFLILFNSSNSPASQHNLHSYFRILSELFGFCFVSFVCWFVCFSQKNLLLEKLYGTKNTPSPHASPPPVCICLFCMSSTPGGKLPMPSMLTRSIT